MSEALTVNPDRRQLLLEFQVEDDLLGVIDAFKNSLTCKVVEMKAKAKDASDDGTRAWAEHGAQQTEESIEHTAPITHVMNQYGEALNFCLQR